MSALRQPAPAPSEPASRGSRAADEGRLRRLWSRFKSILARPVDGASLAVFRIAAGVVMLLETFSLILPSGANIATRITPLETYYTGAALAWHAPYPLFSWLPMLPPAGIYALTAALGLSAAAVALGLFYRISAVLLFLSWGYLYAVESTRTYWMSYYYLELVAVFLLIWIPAARRYSLDARRRKLAPAPIPFWPVFLLRAQLVITYSYAGAAKLNSDWLLHAVPVRDFLKTAGGEGWLQSPALAFFLSYAGAAFDLSIGFLLLFRRTRAAGFVLMVLFHGFNHFYLFDDIVWFPLLGIATATIFLPPDWPERLRRRFAARAPKSVRGPAFMPISRLVPAFAALWILFQAAVPLRHYFIPGDGRFTWEGLAFSWRLKAEIYRSTPAEISLHDPALFSTGPGGKTRIDWNEWKGERILYRAVKPARVDWTTLPELAVILEPELGERILYNPYARGGPILTRPEALERLNELWSALYGRAPQGIHPAIPLNTILDGYIQALHAKGGPVPRGRRESLDMILRLHGRSGNSQMLPILRRMHPFALEGAAAETAPFFVIEDPALFHSGAYKVNRAAWKSPEPGRYIHAPAPPLVIHTALDRSRRSGFPRACVVDSNGPQTPPRISWDYLQDLSISKGMHISTQPFLLQLYAERVAALWEREHGRRPAVYARASVSLNGRPYQLLVDPAADLASVSVRHLWRNPWIRDLEHRRLSK